MLGFRVRLSEVQDTVSVRLSCKVVSCQNNMTSCSIGGRSRLSVIKITW